MQTFSKAKSALASILVGVMWTGTSRAVEEDSEAKTYLLYSGANLKVMEGENTFPIVSINEFTATVDRDGKRVKVTLEKLGRFWIEREMKLNNQSVSIQNLRSGKVFTPGRGKVANWGTVAVADVSANQGPLDIVEGNYFEDSVTLQNSSRSGYRDSPGSFGTLGDHDDWTDAPLDAFEVVLDLASDDHIANPYLVLVTDFRDPAMPDQSSRKFFVKVLEKISREPVTVRLLQGGFPEGFQVEDFNLYLYSGGREVPSNLSDKQVALTRDEAFQYLILEYLVGHKGETLAPRPMWVGMRSEVKDLIRNLEEDPEVNLILDAKGRVVDLRFHDGEGLGPEIIEAFRAFRYYPALEDGQAVEGSYSLRPKELVR
jgi:hypothetical protein